MTGFLVAHQVAVEHITLFLEYERGRQAIAPMPIEVALAEPTWRDEHLARLLRERLAKVTTLEAPVTGLTLQADQLKPTAPANDQLFPEPGGNDTDRTQLLELLSARLGADSVLQGSPTADYRPEVANAWVPAAGERRPAAPQLPPDVAGFQRPT